MRRRLLLGAGAALAAPWLGRALALDAAGAAPAAQVSTIGASRLGYALQAFHLGAGRRRVLVIGGQHGAPEVNTIQLADALRDFFARYPAELPPTVGLDVLPMANPDGYVTGSRFYSTGVDPNRNWSSSDWSADAHDSLGRPWLGLGGPAPMSEPETRQLGAWLRRRRPLLVVNLHSAGGFVSTQQGKRSLEATLAYADASGYPAYGPDQHPWGYPITGALDAWLAGVGIADVFVEMTTPTDLEFEENLAGLRAVLRLLA